MSGSKFSLVDLGKISKPLSKLVDAVSQGIGALYEPTRIRRKARAQGDAALIKAEADIKKKELLRRAANRLAFQEISRQENIENIIEIAAENLPETVSDEPVDRDWISRFFDECKDVSNEELQKIWARLLAGEVASPNSCSRMTLTILKDMSQYDGELFNLICQLIWSSGNNLYIPYEIKADINNQFKEYKIKYNYFLHLDNLGLIHSDLGVKLEITDPCRFVYFDTEHISCSPVPKVKKIAVFPITSSGGELFKVINSEPNLSFYDKSIKMFSDSYGVFLACLLPE